MIIRKDFNMFAIKKHYIKRINLTNYITLVIYGYTYFGKDYNKSCHLEFKNGEIYPII